MNDLEERLRAALDARAGTYTTAPDAYARVQARGSRARRRRWAVLVPVAAAVTAVAALAWSAVAPPAGEGENTSMVSVRGPEQSFEKALRDHPPIGEVLTIPHPDFPDVPIRVWYSRGAQAGPLRFCGAQQITDTGGTMAGCTPVEQWDGEEAGRVGGRTGGIPFPAEVVVFGAAKESVHAVRATVGGRSFPGTVIRGRGMPLPVWTVRFPGDSLGTPPAVSYAFADGRGKPLQRLDDVLTPACHKDREPAGTGVPLPGGVSAHLHAGNCLVFWHDGGQAGLSGGDSRTTLGAGQEQRRQPVTAWAGPGQAVAGRWYGYTGTGTARVELRLRGGGRVSADTVDAFPGQGVRLFGGELPTGADPNRDGAVYVGFDARGDELWRHEVPARGARHSRRPPASQPTPSRR
ncbi:MULTISPECIES: hypothetical protein [Streptosporangium]|uniref:Uncharacterized protein n=1 Tax=Streptosporangium brasiliense TaxID=47480 RepID=A0ABT9RC94_9ACTN|nr:hypothetical protein [Streptosporangium brasiliense]MDP9866768.1 hypothetical protein [Streptosporangium brasiliense]